MDVFVVDPHPIYRRGAVACLRALPDIGTVSEAADGLDEDPALHTATVLLLDHQAPGAPELLDRVCERDGPSVVLCAWSWTAESARAVMHRGAAGVLLKGLLEPESLGSAVRAAAHGTTVMAPELLERLVGAPTPAPLRAPARAAVAGDPGLTIREQRVLRLIADGLANREVARELNYSERTVKNVVHDTVMKLGARSRSQAVASALRSGLI
jgi:DNA-binding NarL/FixJ family response regulator